MCVYCFDFRLDAIDSIDWIMKMNFYSFPYYFQSI